MLRNEVLQMMEGLKLRGMLAVYDEALTNGRKRHLTPEKIILELLEAGAAVVGVGHCEVGGKRAPGRGQEQEHQKPQAKCEEDGLPTTAGSAAPTFHLKPPRSPGAPWQCLKGGKNKGDDRSAMPGICRPQ